MTDGGSQVDRGLQPERTALAWTRTSLAVVVSGVLLLFKDRALTERVEQLALAGTVSVVALSVFIVGVLRRRALRIRQRPIRARAFAEVVTAGTSIVAMASLVVTYLLLPAV